MSRLGCFFKKKLTDKYINLCNLIHFFKYKNEAGFIASGSYPYLFKIAWHTLIYKSVSKLDLKALTNICITFSEQSLRKSNTL